MSKLLEDIVLDLGRKVDAGFQRIDTRFDEVKDDMNGLNIKLKQQQMTILDHSYTDIETSQKIDKLAVKIKDVEKQPARMLRRAGSVLVATIGLVSTVLTIVWTLYKFVS